MTHVVVDPVTRIEGHLRIEAEVDGGQVKDAWSSSTMFRGIEIILKGRDPRDAWAFTQRICGVCTTVHAIASIRAVENAIGATPPPNARLLAQPDHRGAVRAGPRRPLLPPARARLGRHRLGPEGRSQARRRPSRSRSRTGRCLRRSISPRSRIGSRRSSSGDSSGPSPTRTGDIPLTSCRRRPICWRWRTTSRLSSGSGSSSRSTRSSAGRIRTFRASSSAAWPRRSTRTARPR